VAPGVVIEQGGDTERIWCGLESPYPIRSLQLWSSATRQHTRH